MEAGLEDQLVDELLAMGVSTLFEDEKLADGELGAWFPHERVVRIRPGLGIRNRVWTLAHEVGHVVLGHVPATDDLIHSRQEREADEWAARRLVSPVQYALAERLYGAHSGAIADELGVTVRAVEVFREMISGSILLTVD